MELLVFDLALKNVGIIDEFTECRIEINYDKLSELRLIVDASKHNIDLLQEDMILTKADDPEHGYIIKHFEYLDEKSSRLLIEAPSVNKLLSYRTILGQQTNDGNIEDVMKAFVNANAINPANPKRVIPNLILDSNTGIDIEVSEGISDAQLDEYLYELARKYDISWDILLDHENKKFVFMTWQGTDRSSEQSINPHVTFSKELDNVITQQYITDNLYHKTTAIVAGEGEGINRTRITINDEFAGFERKELFVDARDLQSEYRDENDNEKKLTSAQYRELLIERGNNKLTEYQQIRTFESEIDLYSQFKYGVDYFCGDRITIENEDVGIIMHTRIVSAIELYDKNKDDLKLNFGSNIPTMIDSVKRMVRK